MADESIRVVISGTAAELRKALEGAKGDLGGLSAAIKAVPDKLKVDVHAETLVAVDRLKALQIQAGLIPDEINIQANADTGVAEAKLALLQSKARDTERDIARAQLGGSFLASPGGGGDRGGGGTIAGTLGAATWGSAGRFGLGLAGGMTAGSFAGLGAGHVLMTLLGLAGFAGAGAAGGGLLGAGALGSAAVGGGADAAVMKSTIADTKALFTNYQALSTAQEIYGKGSHQAALAQAQLNQQLKELGPAAGAELGLAKQVDNLNSAWNQLTAPARIQAVAILGQGVKAGFAFLPLVADAAHRNLQIVDQDIKPLFAWLEGPHGVGIFINLENHFAQHLPTAIHAFTQGLELLLRVVSISSDYTGGLTKHLDQLLTRLNQKSDAQLRTEVEKLVEDFRDWEALIKLVGEDVVLLFRQGAGTAPAIVDELTQMLQKLHDWETSTRGQASIHNIFVIHKQEILELLQVLPLLIGGFGRLYLALAPVLVPVVVLLAHALADVLKVILDLGKSSGILENTLVLPLGGLAISAKLFGASKVWDGIKATAGAFGILTAAESENAAAANEAAAANARLDAATSVGGARVPFRAGAGSSSTAGVAGEVEQQASGGMAAGLKAGAIRGLAIGGIGTLLSQGIGDSVGGGVGTAISNIGSSASIGAGFGAIFGPEGIAGGALIGGLVGAVATFIRDDAGEQGKKFAEQFSAPLPAAIKRHFDPALADAHAKLIQLQQQATLPQPGAGGRRGGGRPGTIFARQPAQDAAIAHQFFIEGQQAGNETVAGLKSVKVPTTGILTSDFITQLQKLPARARPEAAKVMLSYAEQLALSGKLPKDAVGKMIVSLEKQIPGFGDYLTSQGLKSGEDFAKTLKFEKATNQLKQTLAGFRTQFGDWEIGLNDTTFSALISDTGKAMRRLKQIITDPDTLPAARKAAQAEFDQLRSGMNATLSGATADFKSHLDDIKTAAHNKLPQTVKEAATNFGNYQTIIGEAVASGVISTSDGAKLMHQALQDTLKAFGSKEVVPAVVAVTAGSITASVASTLSKISSFAGGGLLQIGRAGERGHDTIGLSVGGQDIRVGAGEQVAVFNHDQQQVMNQRLGDMGGLPGMFKRHSRPHYMATGGIVGTGWQNVVASAESLGGQGYMGNPIQPYGYSELSVPPSVAGAGSAMGHLPYQTHMRIRAGGREVVAAKQDIGAGSSFDPVMGLYPGTVSQLGLSGGEFRVSIERADGVPLTIGGAAAAAIAKILAPTVKGKGTIADTVRQSFKQEAAAANALVAKLSPALGPGGPGGSASTFAGAGDYRMYRWPLPDGAPFSPGRVDRGQDFETSPHGIFDAIGDAIITSGATDFPGITMRLLAGPAAGMQVFHGHTYQSFVNAGQRVAAGSPLGRVGHQGESYDGGVTHLELGFLTSAGTVAAPENAQHYAYTGQEMHDLLEHIRHFAGGGSVTHGRYSPSSSAHKPKQPKHHKPTKLPKLPRLHSLPGFDQTLLNQIATMSNVTLQDLGLHEGYIEGLHGLDPQLEAIVTLADGSEVVNWDGMIDPSTGKFVKGINARLAEIGDPGNRDISTELGIQDTWLADLIQEQSWAGQAGKAFGPWLHGASGRVSRDGAQKAWLSAAIDPTTPYRKLPPVNFASLGPNLPAGVHLDPTTSPGAIRIPFQTMGSELRRRAKEYKNLLAQKLWAQKLKEQLPLEKQKRDAALTARFAKAKHDIQISGLTSTFDGSQLLSHQLDLLAGEKRDARAGVKGSPPASWLGDTSAWHLEHARELASIDDEFAARSKALRDAAAKHKLSGQVSRSNALFGLSQTEAADKLAASQKFGHRSVDLTDLIRSDTAVTGTDKRWLQGLLSQVTRTQSADVQSLTDAGYQIGPGGKIMPIVGGTGFKQTLDAYLDPLGQLSTDILTKQNIDIRRLLQEIADLKGTTIQPGAGTAGADQSALNALLQQQLANAQTDLAVSQSQFGVFQGFMPLLEGRLLGSFQSGTAFVPQTGPYVLHRGEQVIPDPSGPASNRAAATVHTAEGSMEVVLVMANNEPQLMKLVDARINKRSLQVVSDHSGQRARLMSGVRRP